METFIKEDFLLETEFAKKLYKTVETLPIIDYHCHLVPEEIAQDKNFDNITQIWLYGDHYKWRLMRQAGIEEKYITGNGTDYEKFEAWAQTLECAVGNPLYHWSHLELKNYFGCDGVLTRQSAPEVWKICNDKLASGALSAKKIISMSKVECIGTTDDPADNLEYHQKIRTDKTFSAKVVPTFRPDLLLNAGSSNFSAYINKIQEITGTKICNYTTLCEAVTKRINFFDENGCRSSDHSFSEIPFEQCTQQEWEDIFSRAMKNMPLSETDEKKYETFLMQFLAGEYAKHGWVMQLHFGVVRNTNSKALQTLGINTGFDRIKGCVDIEKLSHFLDELNTRQSLPKTILYSLNPNDNAALDVLANCFYAPGVKGLVQHGAAWWFNDHQGGMENHLTGLAQSGLLSVFVGMLTDSRSLLSYARHEYFRRILCNFIAQKVSRGEFPEDMEICRQIAENVCYSNAKSYFRF